jgi:hypothetical protein
MITNGPRIAKIERDKIQVDKRQNKIVSVSLEWWPFPSCVVWAAEARLQRGRERRVGAVFFAALVALRGGAPRRLIPVKCR